MAQMPRRPLGRLELEMDRAPALVALEDGFKLGDRRLLEARQEDADDDALGLLLEGLGQGHGLAQADAAVLLLAPVLALDPDGPDLLARRLLISP